MRRTFVLVLANHEGSLLAAVRALEGADVAVTRASYNKVIDVHTCFVDVEGEPAQVAAAEEDLRRLGVLPGQQRVGATRVVELLPDDLPRALPAVLSMALTHGLNVTYVDAREEAGEARPLQVGLYVKDEGQLAAFLEEARTLCPAREVRAEANPAAVDTSLFYLGFARQISRMCELSASEEEQVLVNANQIIQNLERTNDDPFKPFDYLRQFAEGLERYRGEAYGAATRVTRLTTAGGAHVLCLEPPAGSDTWVLEGADGGLLVIDCGYACFEDELLGVLRREVPGWDGREKALFLTHGDVDHCGCCDLFGRVYAIDRVLEHFELQQHGEPDWRMQIPTHRPYVAIGDILSRYRTPDLDPFVSLGRRPDDATEPIARCIDPRTGGPSSLRLPPFDFEVWEGAGGHVLGETVLIDRRQRVCVSGDIFVNVHGETKPQARFNALAPFLMTSVDSVPALARAERPYLFGLLGAGKWQVLCGHGAPYAYEGGTA